MRRLIVVALVLLAAGLTGADVKVTLPDGRVGQVEIRRAEEPEQIEAEEPKSAEARPAEPLDLKKLREELAAFERALYRSEQDTIAAKISERLKPHAAQLLSRAKAERRPSLELIRLLGFARNDEASAYLLELLDSSDAAVRSTAAFALGISGWTQAVDELMTHLDDKDVRTASQAAIALGRIGDKRSYEALEKRLLSGDIMTRLSAIRALGLLRDDRAVARLEAHLLKADDPLETTAALDALNRIVGDDLFRIIAQLERVADALEKHGTGRQVQLAQGAITEALDRLIKQAEEQQQGQGQGQGKGKKRRTSSGQQPGQQSGSASGASQGGTMPRTDSNAGDAAATDSAFADITRTAGVVWGNLPPAVQEEITAALKQELPERYKHLLKIYYKILAEGK